MKAFRGKATRKDGTDSGEPESAKLIVHRKVAYTWGLD